MSSDRNNPAGSVTVAQLMEPNVRTVSPELRISSLEEFLLGEEIGGAPVVDEDGKLRGIVSKTDIVRHLTEDLNLGALESEDDVSVGEIMTEHVVTVTADDKVADVARTMVESRVHRVVVTDEEGNIRGILTTLDILKAMI